MLTKSQFIAQVWARVNEKNADVADAILHVATVNNIDIETAARLVSGNQALKGLLEQQSTELHLLRPKVIAEAK